MSLVKIAETNEAPEEGRGRSIQFEHPLTELPYDLALFQLEGTFYVINNRCTKCGTPLDPGTLRGQFVICHNQRCLWHIKKGYCKFDRSSVLPTYKVHVQEDGLHINI